MGDAVSGTVPVVWVSRHPEILARGYADQGLLEAWLDRSAWRPAGAVEFVHHAPTPDRLDAFFDELAASREGGAVVILNARTHASADDVGWLKQQLVRLKWALVLLCGDEEWDFPWRELYALDHDRLRLWAMQPRPEHAEVCGLLPGGWYPRTHELLAPHDGMMSERPLDWFFGGQITHERRQAVAAVLRELEGGVLVETSSYLEEGVDRAEYFRLMAGAKVVPCPSGPYSVDCARAFEALEAGAIPLLDVRSVHGPEFDYWDLLFGAHNGLPHVIDWTEQLPRLLPHYAARFSEESPAIWSFWQQWKRQKAWELEDDLDRLRNTARVVDAPEDLVTVIVTTSPTPVHPDTAHLEQTVDSIRAQLPDVEIVIVADGVRPELEHRTAAYHEYLREVCRLCAFEWHNVVPLVLPEWGHQANAVRFALELVRTPLILFAEHDTPIEGAIDWAGLCVLVDSGAANVVQLYENVELHRDHRRILLEDTRTWWQSRDDLPGDGAAVVPLLRTSAWWQRPHLARTDFYRDLIDRFFPMSARTMIEDRLYPEFATAVADRGEPGWWDWRVYLYAPDGNMRRSGHLDSRAGDPKYEMSFE